MPKELKTSTAEILKAAGQPISLEATIADNKGAPLHNLWRASAGLSNDGRVLTITKTYASGQSVHIVRVLDTQ